MTPLLVLAAATLFRLEPNVITDCRDGLGRATAVWSTDAADKVRISVEDQPMTGLEAAAGSVSTGYWVRAGMRFTLQAEGGAYLGEARAVVRCGLTAWLPLEVGNEWTYRSNTRLSTGETVRWRAVRTEEIAGEHWTVIDTGAAEQLWRVDSEGVLWRRNTLGQTEALTLTPGGLAAAPGGAVAETANYTAQVAMMSETGTFGRGVGLLRMSQTLIAGSSGGFASGLELIEARLGDRVLRIASPGIGLALDPAVRNCAVPCYFTACGLVPGADPPGTVKRCQEVRTWGAASVVIIDASGRELFAQPVSGPETIRLPLWTIPPGEYRVVAAGPEGTAAARLTVQP